MAAPYTPSLPVEVAVNVAVATLFFGTVLPDEHLPAAVGRARRAFRALLARCPPHVSWVGLSAFCWACGRCHCTFLVLVLCVLPIIGSIQREVARKTHNISKLAEKENKNSGEDNSAVAACNAMIRGLWPQAAGPHLATICKTNMNKQLAKTTPKTLKKLEVKRCVMGDAPPVFTTCDISLLGDGSIQMLGNFNFVADEKMVIQIKARFKGRFEKLPPIAIHITKMTMSGTGKMRLSDFTGEKPHVKRVSMTFTQTPEISFSIEPLGKRSFDLTLLPGVGAFLKTMMENALRNHVVEPNKMVLLMGAQAGGSTDKAVATVDLHIKRATNIVSEGHKFIKKHNAICKGSIGGLDFQTKTVRNSSSPNFDKKQTVSMLSWEMSMLVLEVRDPTDDDVLLAYFELDLFEQEPEVAHTAELPCSVGLCLDAVLHVEYKISVHREMTADEKENLTAYQKMKHAGQKAVGTAGKVATGVAAGAVGVAAGAATGVAGVATGAAGAAVGAAAGAAGLASEAAGSAGKGLGATAHKLNLPSPGKFLKKRQEAAKAKRAEKSKKVLKKASIAIIAQDGEEAAAQAAAQAEAEAAAQAAAQAEAEATAEAAAQAEAEAAAEAAAQAEGAEPAAVEPAEEEGEEGPAPDAAGSPPPGEPEGAAPESPAATSAPEEGGEGESSSFIDDAEAGISVLDDVPQQAGEAGGGGGDSGMDLGANSFTPSTSSAEPSMEASTPPPSLPHSRAASEIPAEAELGDAQLSVKQQKQQLVKQATLTLDRAIVKSLEEEVGDRAPPQVADLDSPTPFRGSTSASPAADSPRSPARSTFRPSFDRVHPSRGGRASSIFGGGGGGGGGGWGGEVVKEGWIYKQREKQKVVGKRRFFVLYEDRLEFYNEEEKRNCRGAIEFTGRCNIYLGQKPLQGKPFFAVVCGMGGRQTMIGLATDTEQERAEWMAIIKDQLDKVVSREGIQVTI